MLTHIRKAIQAIKGAISLKDTPPEYPFTEFLNSYHLRWRDLDR